MELELVQFETDITTYEKENIRRGMMALGIPKYRLPHEILGEELTYLDMMGIHYVYNC